LLHKGDFAILLRKKADKSSTQKVRISLLMRLSQTDFNRIIDLACDGVSGWKLHELGARLEDVLRMPLDLIPFPPGIAMPS